MCGSRRVGCLACVGVHWRRWVCGFGTWGDLELGLDFVDFFVDVNEAIEGHVDVPDCVHLVIGQEVGDEVVFVGAGSVYLGEEDFGHVGKAFCVDFNRLALYVRGVQAFAFEHLRGHFQAEFVGDPSRFFGESLECHALPDPLRWLHGDRDPA